MKKPCVFFDRDGIVNVSPGPGYVERPQDFHIIPAFLEALRVVTEKGYVSVIATNQRGVGLGLMTQEALDQIHETLSVALAKEGLNILDIYSCTEDDNSHPDRKPNPGMLLAAAKKYDLDLNRSWMIGDNEKDVLAGKNAGCRTILVSPDEKETVADHQIASMNQLPPFLRKTLNLTLS